MDSRSNRRNKAAFSNFFAWCGGCLSNKLVKCMTPTTRSFNLPVYIIFGGPE